MGKVNRASILATVVLLGVATSYKVLTSDLTFSLFAFYSVTVSALVLARFGLAWKYKPADYPYWQPTVAVVVPAKNEEKVIRDVLHAWAQSDYPRDKFSVLVIDDGSTDDTWTEIQLAQRELGPRLRLESHRFQENRGKRRALAWGFRATKSEVIVASDSDSFPEPNALREIVRPLGDAKVAGVVGHVTVRNPRGFWAKIQAPWYHMAFRLVKSAESKFGSVICLSGCLAAYRRDTVMPLVDGWENQTFLSAPCTFGDDRSLTRLLLREGFETVYWKESRAETVVPNSFRSYWRQQLRWRKSWLRETWLLSTTSFRRSIGFALYFLAQTVAGVLGFVVLLRLLVYLPLTGHMPPFLYLAGLGLVGLVYFAYNGIEEGPQRSLSKYIFGYLLVQSLVLVWLTPIALLKIREPGWGSRGV